VYFRFTEKVAINISLFRVSCLTDCRCRVIHLLSCLLNVKLSIITMDSNNLENMASNIPKEAWGKLVDTACETFVKIVYPLTATTEGIGRLIERRFNNLNDEQKIIASKCMEDASNKIKNSKRNVVEKRPIKPAVIYEALENSENQTDVTIRELWANLLANEFMEGNVHPEIAKILGKITSQDALLLASIAENDPQSFSIKVLKILMSTYSLGIFGDKKTFNHVHLEKLGLIAEIEKCWYLTVVGKEFIRCASDPT